MAIPKSRPDLELGKFYETIPDKVTVRVGFDGSAQPITFVPGAIGTQLSLYNNTSSVLPSVRTQINTYTVPATQDFFLNEVEFYGDNVSVYEIEINSTIEARKRTYYTKLDEKFLFYELKLVAGDIISIFAENKSISAGDYDSRIIGLLV